MVEDVVVVVLVVVGGRLVVLVVDRLVRVSVVVDVGTGESSGGSASSSPQPFARASTTISAGSQGRANSGFQAEGDGVAGGVR